MMYLFLGEDGNPHLSAEQPPEDALWVKVDMERNFFFVGNRFIPIIGKAAMELQKKLTEMEFHADLARRDEII